MINILRRVNTASQPTKKFPRAHSRRRALLSGASALILGITLTACSTTAASSSNNVTAVGLTGGTNISGKTVELIIYDTPTTSFFVPVVNGAKAAAKLMGLKLRIEYSNASDSTEVDQIDAAISTKVAGLALSLPDTGENAAVIAAHKAGIPMVAFNVDGATGSAAADILAYMGQNFVSAGKLIAEHMISLGEIKQGANVFCPVGLTTAVYAVQRLQGVNDALRPLGITCHVLATTPTPATSLTDQVNYLLGHRSTTAEIALGETALSQAPSATVKAGLHIPIGGFDLSQTVLQGISNGSITATVDQQPYSQGFYAIEQLGLFLRYGLYPSNMNTGGKGLVTKSNVSKVASLVPSIQ